MISISNRALISALFFCLVSVPALNAFAKLSKKTKEELTGYAAKFDATTDTDARVAWLLTRGMIVTKKERSTIETYKTNDDDDIKLAAGLALYFAGDKKALKFAGEQFASHPQRFRVLRTYVATIDDKTEAKILTAWLKGAKPEVVKDILRYAAETPAHRPILVKRLNDKKNETFRRQAWEALSVVPPKDVLKILQKKTGDKIEAERAAALNLAIAMTESPKWKASAIKVIEKVAKSDKAPVLKEKAARALVEMNVSGSGNLLFDATPADKPEQQLATMKFVLKHNGKISASKLKGLLESKDAETKRSAYILSAMENKKLSKKLQEMYGSVEFDDRLIGVSAIGMTKSKAANLVLGNALFEGDNRIRMAAVIGLRYLASPAMLPKLKQALGAERDKKIKFAIVEAIASVKTKDALQILRFQLTGRDAAYKRKIVEGIRAIGLSAGAKALEVPIKDRNIETQWATFLAMVTLDAKLASKFFKVVFRNPPAGYLDDIDSLDPGVRKTILAYLFKNGGPSTKGALVARSLKRHEFLKETYAMVDNSELSGQARADIAFHMANNAKVSRPVLEKLVRRTITPGLAHTSMWILGRSPSKNDEATFRGLLGNKDQNIGAIALYALARLKS